MRVNFRNAYKLFLLCILTISVFAGCGGGVSGSGSGSTSKTLEVTGLASDPPAVLAGEQTVVTASAYVSGSYVELQKFDGTNYNTIGQMKDDGQNGDLTAGDKVYTIQITVNEATASNIIYRLKTTSNGQEQTREISIPVVQIPVLATNAEFNQEVSDLFSLSLETQLLVTALNNDIVNTSIGTVEQVGNNLLTMFAKFEAVTNQDFFSLFSLSKKAQSVNQLMDIFSENPFDSRVDSVKQGVIDSGCLGEVDLSIVSPLELRLCARYYLFNGTLNPNGEGVQLLKDSQGIIVKELVSEPVSIAGDGVSTLFNLGFLGTVAVSEVVGQGVGIVVDWFLDDGDKQNILIGKVQDGEQFSVPSGKHNILYSFGQDKPKAISLNTHIPPQQTTTVVVSPGAISYGETPVGPSVGDYVSIPMLTAPNKIAIEFGGSTALVTEGYEVSRVTLSSGAVTTIASGLTNSPVDIEIENYGVSALLIEGDRLSRLDLSSGTITLIATGFVNPTGVSLEPDGQSALVVDQRNNGTLSRVNLANGATTTIVSGFPYDQFNSFVHQVAIEPGGQSAIVAHGSSSLSRVDLNTGNIATFTSGYRVVTDIAFETGGGTALVIGNSGGVGVLQRVDLKTGISEILYNTGLASYGTYSVRGLAIVPGGSTVLYISNTSGSHDLFRFDLSTRQRAVLAYGVTPKYIALEAGGATALVTDNTFFNGLYRVNLSSGIIQRITGLDGPTGIAIEQGGATALVTRVGTFGNATDRNALIRVNLTDGSKTLIATGLVYPGSVAVEPGGTSALFFEGYDVFGGVNISDSLVQIDLASGLKTTIATGLFRTGVLVVEAGVGTALLTQYGELSRINLNTGVLSTIAMTPGNKGLVIEPGGTSVLSGAIGILYRVDLPTGLVTQIASFPPGAGGAVAIEPNGKTALVGGSSGLVRVRVNP